MRADPSDVRLLERAFGRVPADWCRKVTGVEVSAPSGSLVVVMDFVGSPTLAARECERLFAVAWYDAFGVRGSTHTVRILEESAV